MATVAVCIASFNRRERTLECLAKLCSATLPDGLSLVVHLLDDGSSDGTAAAVEARFPAVRLHRGDGNCFWAGGMRIAYGAALAEHHDYYIWLNDDVELLADSLQRAILALEDIARQFGGEHIVIGAMRARETETTTYGGFVRESRIFPWRFRRIDPDPDRPRECETINGNFVLIPGTVAQRLGKVNPSYIQMHADLDLGLSARRAGVRNWVLPGYAGICDANVSGRKNWKAPGLAFSERLRIMEHPLGYPLKANIAYSRNFGWWAPIMVAAPYVALLRASLIRARKRNERAE
jgi:GT2 family glycosyltransferase